MLFRTAFALLVAALLAVTAHRVRALSAGGAAAAAVVGTCCLLGGVDWVALLLFFFISSTVLSAWRDDARRALLNGMVDKGAARDAWQVGANGAVFALAALGWSLAPAMVWRAIGVGAIGAATADTWSTEVGTVRGGTPRHILNGRTLPHGASGGITAVGTLAGVIGATAVALLAVGLRWRVPFVATVAGGIAGLVADSLLGATLQERRWCNACGRMTERRVHNCATRTEVRGGLRGYTNDAVNLTSVILGALVTSALS